MTQPISGPPVWEQGLIEVLGAGDMDSRRFTQPSWVTLIDAGHYIKTKGAKPWDDPMGTVYENEFTLYRRTAASISPGTSDQAGVSHEAFWIIKGRVDWYAKADGKYSPHEYFWNEFMTYSYRTLYSPSTPLPLDPESFDTAAESFYNLAVWLDGSVQILQSDIDSIGDGNSGFEGLSAESLRQSLRNLRDEMRLLRQDLETANNWVQMLHDNAEAARGFWNGLRKAWDDFRGHPEWEPNNMVAAAMRDIESEVEKLSAQTKNWDYAKYQDGTIVAWDKVKDWIIPIDIGNGTKKPYDFRHPDVAIAELNADMHQFFATGIANLHNAMSAQLKTLRDSFDTTYQNLVDPQTFVPPPSTDGTGGGGGTDDLLDQLGLGDGLKGLGDGFKGLGDGMKGLGDGAKGLGDGFKGLGDGALGLGDGFKGLGDGALGLGDGIKGGAPDLEDLLDGGPNLGNAGDGGIDGLDNLSGTGTGGAPDLDDLLGGGTGGGAGLPGGTGGTIPGGLPLPGLGGGGLTGGGTIGKPGNDGKPVPPELHLPDDGDFTEGPTTVGGLPHVPGLGGAGAGVGGDFPGLGGASSTDTVPGLGNAGVGFGGGDFAGGRAGAGTTGPNGLTVGTLGPAPVAAGGAIDGLVRPVAGTGLSSGGPGGGGFPPPMIPPMGGQQEKDRERTTWLAEEEEVWGTDPDVAPAVVGRDELPEAPTERSPWSPTGPQAPGSPYGPGRGVGQQTRRTN
ncbi:WXG100 family type VII secretion target [Micromonospora krabiensis]|uniref:Uncharacterized protein n=1 Tax=Micromonospora krabiensis TaxID=307121 RepID=A0A1C3MXK0_9ACTN|nr:hypothetical protein [Micromonospora krabiensis]SBV25062.1 hypothetical protein GA0070620_0531 [Micromonospora krabiensis]